MALEHKPGRFPQPANELQPGRPHTSSRRPAQLPPKRPSQGESAGSLVSTVTGHESGAARQRQAAQLGAALLSLSVTASWDPVVITFLVPLLLFTPSQDRGEGISIASRLFASGGSERVDATPPRPPALLPPPAGANRAMTPALWPVFLQPPPTPSYKA